MTTAERPHAAQRAAEVLRDAGFLSLGTVGSDGAPWVAQAQYAVLAGPLRVLFGSSRSSRHVEDVEASPLVAASMSLTPAAHGRLDGVQVTGRCHAVTGDRLPVAADLFYARLFPDPGERAAYEQPVERLDGDGAHRLLELVLERVWVVDLDRWEREQVSARVEVDPAEVGRLLTGARGLDTGVAASRS